MSEVWIEMVEIVLNIYLFWGTVQDIKEKSISNCFIKIGIIIGSISFLRDIYLQVFSPKEWLWSLIPGVVFLLIAKISKEKVGYGDGIVFLILGGCMKTTEIWCLWQISLLLDVVYSLIMMAIKKIDLHSKVAFLPFVWIAHILLMCHKFAL